MNKRVRKLTGTAMLSALAYILMFLEFPIPFLIPPFIKMDFSELYRHTGIQFQLIGSLIGAAVMGVVSLFTNYYVVYPIYTNFMPMEAIIGAYQLILPSVDDLWDCLLIFNLPFTIFKGLCSVLISMLIYKPLRNILKGNTV